MMTLSTSETHTFKRGHHPPQHSVPYRLLSAIDSMARLLEYQFYFIVNYLKYHSFTFEK